MDRAVAGSEVRIENPVPGIAESLLADIPRIEEVRGILHHLNDPLGDGEAGRGRIPMGSRILRAVLELDVLESQDLPLAAALEVLRGRPAEFDPAVVVALGNLSEDEGPGEEIRELALAELRSGMVLVDPVEGTDGRLLVAHGQEVSVGLLERLMNFSQNMGVKEPIRVAVRAGTPR